ncbi:hypothetical protein M3Y97_00684400 [Aphelenchoides bicaudatus]|nr:hypothetical protein M3Y97_00684400 [Aphelenchoides bicaudatus]
MKAKMPKHVKETEAPRNTTGKDDIHNIFDRKSYQVLLKTKRDQQTLAVKSMFAVPDNKRLKTVLADVVAKMKNVLDNSMKVVQAAKFTPSSDAFPTEDPLRESVAKLIENTAFYFEMTVFLPDFMDYFTHKDKEMKPLVKWCFEFVQKMDIYDTETANTVLNGVQELLITPRPNGYKNPYRKIYLKNMKQQEAFELYKKMLEEKDQKKADVKKKPKKLSGPKLSRSEL